MSEDVGTSPATGTAAGYEPASWIRLIVVLWSGPHWWATHLGLTYLVVPETCMYGLEWTLHLITVGTAAGCVVGWWVSRRLLQHANHHREVDRYARRDAYLAWGGIFLGLFFLAVTLMEGVPALFLSPCW